jgi:hypothetical protein
VFSTPAACRSQAWLFDSDSRLNPRPLSASIASGGDRNPRPPLEAGSTTVASKFVKTTSPLRSGATVCARAGVWTRTSVRVVD